MTQKRKNENDLVVSGNAAAPRRKAARSRAKHSMPAEPAVPVSATPEATEPASVLPDATLSVTTLELSVASPVTGSEPAYDDVARLAYSYWEARGFQGGSAEEDWLRAEQAIRGGSAVEV